MNFKIRYLYIHTQQLLCNYLTILPDRLKLLIDSKNSTLIYKKNVVQISKKHGSLNKTNAKVSNAFIFVNLHVCLSVK